MNYKIFAILGILICGLHVYGGGPFMVDEISLSGEPSRWPMNRAVQWKLDKDAENIQIHSAVTGVREKLSKVMQDLFSKWSDAKLPNPDWKEGMPPDQQFIDTVALRVEYDGLLPEDVTAANYTNYVKYDLNNLGPSVVLFDKDGTIIEALCLSQPGAKAEDCKKQKNGIAGVAAPLNRDSSSKVILNAFAVINGRLIDGVSNEENHEMDTTQFQGVILHELGHFLNVGHSQINLNLSLSCSEDFSDPNATCPGAEGITTMFPSSKTKDQFKFHRDDVVAMALLYPTDAFKEKYCMILGKIVNGKGNGIPGINVVGAGVSNPIVDARSMVTGVYFPPPVEGRRAPDGHYVLAGLVPGQDYEITYEELTHVYDKGGGFEPLGAESPTGISGGLIAGEGGKQTVRCGKGGEMITMPDFKLPAAGDPAASSSADDTQKKKGWFCQLMPQDHLTYEEPSLKFTAWLESLSPFSFFFFFLILLWGRRALLK